ncbi:MAG TPA: hypothetical protein VMU19_06085 [Bryobacteraceae bacterium]|nr:hypothetical protein [Bryobacteraceae bacterium]
MEMDPVRRYAALLASDPVSPAGNAAEVREILQAVRAVNRSEMFGGENFLDYQIDPGTRKATVRLLRRKTREEVDRYPAEYIVRMAEDLNS